MKKINKKKLPKYPLGGFKGNDITLKDVGQFAGNYTKAGADTTLSAFGMGNVINESDYKGQSAQDFNKISNITGGITKAALPLVAGAAGMVMGGPQGAQLGMAAAKGVQGLGSQFNPSDNQGLTDEQIQAQQMGGQAGNVTGQIGNLGMNALNIYNMSKQMKNGGRMKYAEGGMNSEVEKQENAITPNGEFTQYDGPSHEQGGIPTNLENGEMVFSDRLKSGKKTFAQLNKANNTTKEDKLLEDSKSNTLQKLTAQLMKEAKLKQSMKLFNEQESLKQAKIDKYAGRIGYKFPDGGRKVIDRSAYSNDFQRYEKSGAGNYDISGDISDSNFKNLGFTRAKDVTDKYPVYVKDNNYLIRNDAGTAYVSAGNASNLKYMGQPNPTVNSASFGQQPTTQQTNQLVKQAEPLQPTSNAPVKQPMSFGPNQNYNPNTGAYTNPVTGANIAPIVEQYKSGGIHIKPSHEGRFTAYKERTGKTTEEALHSSNPHVRQMANFARNASHWKHAEGGVHYDDGGLHNSIPFKYDNQNNGELMGNPQYQDAGTIKNYQSPDAQNQGNGTNWGKVAGQVGIGLAQNIGNIYDINRGRKVETQHYDRAAVNTVDPSAELRYNNAAFNSAKEDVKNASVGNSSTYIQNRKDLAINQMMANARIKAQYDNQNASMQNQGNQFNANISMQEQNANAMNRAQGRNLIGSGVSGIGQNIMNQNRDIQMGNRDQDLLGLLAQHYPQATQNPAFAAYYQKNGIRTK